MNRETPPSIEDDVAWVWLPDMLAPRFDVEKFRRAPSWPEAKKDALREAELRGDGFCSAIAEIEDMAGGALAE